LLTTKHDSGERPLRRYAFRRGLFFFDMNWNEVRQWQDEQRLFYSGAASSAVANTKIESNQSKKNGKSATTGYLIDRWPLHMPAGTYHLSLEVMDRNSGHSGAERETILVEDFATDHLSSSSVVLAVHPTHASSAGSTTESSPGLALYRKGEVNLVPSLFRQFSPSTPIYVYYEVYNLSLDANGQSRYRIDNVVEPVQENKSLVARTVGRIGQLLGLGERPVSVTSSFESTGNSRTEKLYYSLEMLGREAGRYDLTIRLTDRISGESTSRRVGFEIVAHP
jgi:hypothetical protein